MSLFAGKVADEGGYASEVIRLSVEWLKMWKHKSRIVVRSIRSVWEVLNVVVAGAIITTIPRQYLFKMVDHKFSREMVKQLLDDADKALELM